MNKTKKIIITVCMLAASVLTVAATVPDSIDVKVREQHDSLEIQITAYKIETQLTFLMQGLNIRVDQLDSVTLIFPSAPMVRNKVKRHPNEVKAVLGSQRKREEAGHDSINQVVRPDILPLVAALNDTTATLSYHGMTDTTHGFKIDVDRENAVMVFSIKVPTCYIDTKETKLDLCLYSIPVDENRQEFTGRRLSDENSARPNGLGEGFRKGYAASRTFYKVLSVIICKYDKEHKLYQNRN